MENINEIYARISRNEIPLDDGARKIVAWIYNNPALFGLSYIDSDFKSDIILKLLERMPKYIANYSDSKSVFSTYLITVISNLLKTGYREQFRQKAHESSIMYYLNETGAFLPAVLADSSAPWESSGTYAAFSAENESEGGCKKLKPKHILILALKACRYLDEKQIRRIAQLTGHSESDIAGYKYRLEKSMQKRLEQYEELKQRLNSSYMLKNRCFLQLMTLPPDSALFKRIAKNYTFYTQSWKNRLRLYAQAGRLRPTNVEIAKVLNMKLYQVYQALRYMREAARGGERKEAGGGPL